MLKQGGMNSQIFNQTEITSPATLAKTHTISPGLYPTRYNRRQKSLEHLQKYDEKP